MHPPRPRRKRADLERRPRALRALGTQAEPAGFTRARWYTPAPAEDYKQDALELVRRINDRLDEACGHTLQAIGSGRVVPSNQWRAAEVVGAVEGRGLPEAVELRKAYEQMRRATPAE